MSQSKRSTTGLRLGMAAASLLVSVMVVALAEAQPAGASVAVGSRNLVSTRDTPDPAVTYSGSGTTYYAYSTSSTWTFAGIGMTPLSCTAGGCGVTGTTGVAVKATIVPVSLDVDFGLQAPSVAYIDGQWVMYYAGVYAPATTGAFAVYDSTSSSPTSGFSSSPSETPLMYQASTGGSTDPSIFISPTGQPWLQWKSSTYRTDGTPAHLWSMGLAANGLSMTGTAHVLLTQPTSGWDSATIENPQMVWSGGTYYLFFSGGKWNSTGYAEGYTTCSGPTGGCGEATTSPILATGASAPYGPGGASLFTSTTGSWLMAYHGWTGKPFTTNGIEHPCATYACGGSRQLYVSTVSGLYSTSLPNIRSFTASATTLPANGGTVTLSASATRAVSYTFSSNRTLGGLPKTVNTLSGSAGDTVHLPANTSTSPETYTFTVTATGSYGGQVDRQTTVSVAPEATLEATLSADVTGNGRNDLISVYSDGTWVSLSTGTGFSTPQKWSSTTFRGSITTLAGDLTGNGKTDLIAVDGTSTWVMLSTGTGFSAPQEWWS